MNARPPRIRRWMKLAASALALATTILVVGAKPMWSRLRELAPTWLGVGLAITLLQFALLAARWRFVAHRLGLVLSFRRALGEYYLSTLLNYVVPLGGDALRAVRHADRAGDETGRPIVPVLSAILLERTSGQLAIWLVVIAIAPNLLRRISISMGADASIAWLGALAIVACVALVWVLGRRWLARLYAAAAAGGRVLLSPGNLFVHLSLSLVLVVTHVALFAVAARSIGLELGWGAAVRVVPPVLLASSVPAFLGGFGLREAATAALYHLTGLHGADGAAISLAYGTIGLLGSLPGVITFAAHGRAPTVRPSPAPPP